MNFNLYKQASYLSLVLFITLFAILFITTDSFADSRNVTVNGVRISGQQLAQLDYMACTRIPNGSYWLNPVNGAWGYAGNWQVQGYFGDQCRGGGSAKPRKSLSERGLLFRPGEIINGY